MKSTKRGNETSQLRSEEVEALNDVESEAGTFKRASADEIAKRKIIKVNRKNSSESSKPLENKPFNNPFSNFNPTNTVSNPFSGFQGLASNPSNANASTTTAIASNGFSNVFTPAKKIVDDINQKNSLNPIVEIDKNKVNHFDNTKNNVYNIENKSNQENIITTITTNDSELEYKKKQKKLNSAFNTWINKQIVEHPLLIWKEAVKKEIFKKLIKKDYVQHYKKIEEKFSKEEQQSEVEQTDDSRNNNFNNNNNNNNYNINNNNNNLIASSSLISNKKNVLEPTAINDEKKSQPPNSHNNFLQPTAINDEIKSQPPKNSHNNFFTGNTSNSSSFLFPSSSAATTSTATTATTTTSNFLNSNKSIFDFKPQQSLAFNLPTTIKSTTNNFLSTTTTTDNFLRTDNKFSNSLFPSTNASNAFSIPTTTNANNTNNNDNLNNNIFKNSFNSSAPLSFNLQAGNNNAFAATNNAFSFNNNNAFNSNNNKNTINNNDDNDDEAEAKLEPEKVTRDENDRDEILHSVACKLFRFDKDANEWKDVGKGDFRITKNKDTNKIRMLIRNAIGKITFNASFYKNMEITRIKNNSLQFFSVVFDEVVKTDSNNKVIIENKPELKKFMLKVNPLHLEKTFEQMKKCISFCN